MLVRLPKKVRVANMLLLVIWLLFMKEGSKINSHYDSLFAGDGENRTGGSESETDCERGI